MNQYTKEQQLLMDEIINKGYDAADFQEFVTQTNPLKAADIESWTYEELSAVILEYQQQKTNQSSSIFKENVHRQVEAPVDHNTFEIVDDQVYQQCVKAFHEKIKLGDKINVDPYSKQVQCKPIKYHIEFDLELTFDLGKPFQSSGGMLQFFISKNVLFPVTVMPMQWKITRTLQDFQQLRLTLSNEFPDLILPCFNTFNCDDFKSIVEKQDRILSEIKSFLNVLSKIPILRTSYYYICFLNESNESQFSKRFYKQGLTTKQFKLQDKQKKNATIDLELTQDKFNKCLQYQRFINNDFGVVEEIANKLESFHKNMENAISDLQGVVQLSDKLIHKLNTQNNQMQEYSNIYLYFRNVINDFSEELTQDVKHVSKNLTQYIYRLDSNKQSMVAFKSNLSESYQIYTTDYNQLERRKDELFAIKDVNKWKLSTSQLEMIDSSKAYINQAYGKSFMYANETRSVNDKLDQYVYMVDSFIDQMDKFLLKEQNILISRIKTFLNQKSEYSKQKNEKCASFNIEVGQIQSG